MNYRVKNLRTLHRICFEKGLSVAQTNSRRSGFTTSIRVYACHADKGKPERALFSFGSYVNLKDLEEVRAY